MEQTEIAPQKIRPMPEVSVNSNPFENSTTIQKLTDRKEKNLPLRIAFFDIDSTITGDRNKMDQIRQKLEDNGYVVAFVTSRTEEMIMTKEEQKKSPTLKRPTAQLGKDEQGKRVAVDPRDVEPKGLLDPDIIAGATGSRVLIKQKNGGYQVDNNFEVQMKAESKTWRKGVMSLLDYINKEKHLCQAIPIEYEENFAKKETDVFPPDFRIQVNFPDLSVKQEFMQRIQQFKLSKKLDLLSQGLEASAVENILNIRITDDSKPSENRFSAYLTPTRGYKARAEEEIVKNVCQQMDIKREDLELLIAGDSFPDLGMGLYGGINTQATFILANGSRLTKPLLEKEIKEFSGVGLTEIKNRLNQISPGSYEFKPPLFKPRKVVICDEAYPGMSNQDSILAFLQTIAFFEKHR